MMDSTKKWVDRSTRNKRHFWAVSVCFFLSLLFLLFQGGKLASMLFVVVSILCAYLLLGRWSGVGKSQGTRHLSNSEQELTLIAGNSMSVRIRVHIPGFWPIPYVFVKDRLMRKKGEEHWFEGSFIPDWKRTGEISYRTVPLRRGIYQFTHTECSTEDVFGLFEHTGVLPLNQTFKVLPQTVEIREWKHLNRMFKGLYRHSSTTRSHRETTQINGVREYNYGDRLSRIHWNATAKTGSLKSKEFERESLPKTIVVLDCRRSHYKSNDQFELAVSIAASLCEFGAKKDLAVGMLVSGKLPFFIEPKRSSGGHQQLIRELIEVEADGQLSMRDALKDKMRFFEPGTLVTVISPNHGQDLYQTLQFLAGRQMNICHMWVASEAKPADGDVWSKRLASNGFLGYAVHSLQDLPALLGGRSS